MKIIIYVWILVCRAQKLDLNVKAIRLRGAKNKISNNSRNDLKGIDIIGGL